MYIMKRKKKTDYFGAYEDLLFYACFARQSHERIVIIENKQKNNNYNTTFHVIPSTL